MQGDLKRIQVGNLKAFGTTTTLYFGQNGITKDGLWSFFDGGSDQYPGVGN